MRFFSRKREDALLPEWIIVGLGNPGAEYRGTRHNVGFEVIDRLAKKNGIRVDRGKNRAVVGSGRIGGVPVLLVKPLTYMNLSGQAVGPIARNAKVTPNRILVIADDMDLPVGRVKMRLSGSAGGHNGHKSLIQYLGSQEYPRIKIGIGKAGPAIEHVLGDFEEDERGSIEHAEELAVGACERAATEGIQAALNFIANAS